MVTDNERIGALVKRYRDNSLRVGGLQSSIEEKAQLLYELAGAFQRRYPGKHVEFAEDALQFTRSDRDGGATETVPLTLLADIHAEMAALDSAIAERERTIEHLKQADLGYIVRG